MADKYVIHLILEIFKESEKLFMTIPDEIKKLSFEEALSELEQIVENLERGDIELEDSISIYEKGVILKAHCEDKLKTAKMKIDKIISHPDGDFSSEPLDEI